MPELADVEGFRRVLDEHARGRRVERVTVHDARVLRGVSKRTFSTTVRHAHIDSPRRHGKWLIVPLRGTGGADRSDNAGAALLMHFGMTGSLEWADPGDERHRHDRVVLVLDNGELRFHDMRKLEGLHLARGTEELDNALGALGPDAWDISRAELRALLRPLRRQIKTAMTDQAVIAGLGNLLADEILWRACVDPRRKASSLEAREYDRLHGRMRTTLRRAAQAGEVPGKATWLTGRRDEPSGTCPRCAARLEHKRTGGRRTVWCPRCQPPAE